MREVQVFLDILRIPLGTKVCVEKGERAGEELSTEGRAGHFATRPDLCEAGISILGGILMAKRRSEIIRVPGGPPHLS